MEAIATERLTKAYEHRLAVDDFSLTVRRGEAFGLLGPNGAGKSTCVKMLLGLAFPTSGRGHLLGRPLGHREGLRRVGFLPERFHFQDWLSGAEMLSLHGRLYGMDRARLRRKIPELLERVGLHREGDKRLGAYSKGMQQRIGLAQALLNDPEVIFLDEPTSGLDPLGRILVRDVIREQRERGATIFLNSHLLGEVEASCDRVAFVKRGRLLDVRELGRRVGALRVRVRIGDQVQVLDVPAEADLPQLLRRLVAEGAPVAEFTPLRTSLEEQFLEVIGSEEAPT